MAVPRVPPNLLQAYRWLYTESVFFTLAGTPHEPRQQSCMVDVSPGLPLFARPAAGAGGAGLMPAEA